MIRLREDVSNSETTLPVDSLSFPIGMKGNSGEYHIEKYDLYFLGDPAEVVWVQGIIEGDEPAVVVSRGGHGAHFHPTWGKTRNRKKGDRLEPIPGFMYVDGDIYWRYGPQEAEWTPAQMRALRVDCQEIPTIIDIEDAARMGLFDLGTGLQTGGRYSGAAHGEGRRVDTGCARRISDGNPG